MHLLLGNIVQRFEFKFPTRKAEDFYVTNDNFCFRYSRHGSCPCYRYRSHSMNYVWTRAVGRIRLSHRKAITWASQELLSLIQNLRVSLGSIYPTHVIMVLK
jgi:hypothetical protein